MVNEEREQESPQAKSYPNDSKTGISTKPNKTTPTATESIMQVFTSPDLATDEEITLALAEIEKAFTAAKEAIALFDKIHAIAIKALAKHQPL